MWCSLTLSSNLLAFSANTDKSKYPCKYPLCWIRSTGTLTSKAPVGEAIEKGKDEKAMLLRKEGERIERQTSSQLCLERKLQNYPELFRAFMQFPTSLTATDVATSCQIALMLPAQSLYIDHKNNPRRESRFFFSFKA